jgi:ATP-dependent protease ClpP protease subunit
MKAMLLSLLLLVSLSCQAEVIQLTTNNTINIRTQIDGNSVSKAMKEIAALREKSPNETLYIVLNSPGGSIPDGLDFIRFLDTQENIKTITIFAASMASAIVEANKGERLIVEDGILMFHRARVGVQGQIGEGELESQLENIKRIVESLEIKNADRMDLSLKEYRAKVKDEYWLFGKQAVKEDGADKIVKIHCSSELIKAKDIMEMRSFFGSVTVEFSQCPLFTYPTSVKESK